MQQDRSYKLVGLFVVLGFLFFAGVIFHYINKQFTTDDSNLVVMYFEESIQGLNVGSSVVFKGVEIGKVAKIRLLTNLKDGTFKMPVYVSFKEKRSFQVGRNESISGERILQRLVEKGLHARLISANYLTGQLMIELDMDPNVPAVMRGTGDHMEIPTMMSSFGMISKDLQDIPIRENMLQLGSLLKKLDESLPPILDNLTSITAKMDVLLDSKVKDADRALNTFNNAMEDLGRASSAIRNLADYLERHPEAVLTGKRREKE